VATFPFFQLKLSTLSWNKLKKEVGHLGGWPTCKPQLHQKLMNKLFSHLCWKSLFFSPFLVEKHRYLLTWKKKVGVWWPVYFGAFCVELEKRKNSLQKLCLEIEISKPESFGWNRTNINSLFVIRCYIMHWRYSLTPCKGLGVWKMRHPKIVVTIKANLIQWKSKIKLPILALPKLYKEFTTHKNHRKPFLNTQYNDTLMHMHTHKFVYCFDD
jgi:hypothetical protein